MKPGYIYFTPNEWREMLIYRTPVKTFMYNVGPISTFLGRKPRAVTLGGHKHPIIEGSWFQDGKRMYQDKEIIVRK